MTEFLWKDDRRRSKRTKQTKAKNHWWFRVTRRKKKKHTKAILLLYYRVSTQRFCTAFLRNRAAQITDCKRSPVKKHDELCVISGVERNCNLSERHIFHRQTLKREFSSRKASGWIDRFTTIHHCFEKAKAKFSQRPYFLRVVVACLLEDELKSLLLHFRLFFGPCQIPRMMDEAGKRGSLTRPSNVHDKNARVETETSSSYIF